MNIDFKDYLDKGKPRDKFCVWTRKGPELYFVIPFRSTASDKRFKSDDSYYWGWTTTDSRKGMDFHSATYDPDFSIVVREATKYKQHYQQMIVDIFTKLNAENIHT